MKRPVPPELLEFLAPFPDRVAESIRHVTCRSVDDAGAPWVDDYVRAALANAGFDASMGDGGTTVRMSRGPKRRPH